MSVLTKFSALPTISKLNALDEFGIYLSKFRKGPFEVKLYRVNNFYVEKFIDAQTRSIKKFRAFKSLEYDQKYHDIISEFHIVAEFD